MVCHSVFNSNEIDHIYVYLTLRFHSLAVKFISKARVLAIRPYIYYILKHLAFSFQDDDYKVYTEYCTNYPSSVAAMTRCMKNPNLVDFFKVCLDTVPINLLYFYGSGFLMIVK